MAGNPNVKTGMELRITIAPGTRNSSLFARFLNSTCGCKGKKRFQLGKNTVPMVEAPGPDMEGLSSLLSILFNLSIYRAFPILSILGKSRMRMRQGHKKWLHTGLDLHCVVYFIDWLI